MPKYVTIAQYKQTGDYPITADLTDLVLTRTVSRAESDIDAAMEFHLRIGGGFEPHRAWAQSQWDNKRLRTRVPNVPVPIRRALAYRIQVSNLTSSGAGFMAIINTGDVAYNTSDFYVEIVPLQSITYSLAPVLIQMGLDPPLVQLEYEAGFYLPVWGETLFDSGDHTTYYAARGFWATSYNQATSLVPAVVVPPVPPVIYKNGVVVASGYTLDTTEGNVIFGTANAASDVVSADYTYQVPDNVRDACVLQTTWLLAQRALNQMGMAGVDWVRSGDQQIKRYAGPPAEIEKQALCAAAAGKLKGYTGAAVA